MENIDTQQRRQYAHRFSESHSQPRWRQTLSLASESSCHSDEGYHSEDKPNSNTFGQHSSRRPECEIPILKSPNAIRITYTRQTLLLTLLMIGYSIYSLVVDQPYWSYSFPTVFVAFSLVFHTTHLIAHYLRLLTIERLCVAYGTLIFWNGWLLGVLVFSERLPVMVSHPMAVLFWLLLLERRNAWGIVIWEFVSQLEQHLPVDLPPFTTEPVQLWHLGTVRLLAFRLWYLVGAGSFWGLLYIPLATYDGFALLYILKLSTITWLFLVSIMGGLSMICFWSFWTFQYRGIVWKDEMRNGVAIWFSDGIALSADVH